MCCIRILERVVLFALLLVLHAIRPHQPYMLLHVGTSVFFTGTSKASKRSSSKARILSTSSISYSQTSGENGAIMLCGRLQERGLTRCAECVSAWFLTCSIIAWRSNWFALGRLV